MSFYWQDYSDEELLDLRFCDLGLDLTNTNLLKKVEPLYAELEEKSLSFRPQFYIGDEWFSPENTYYVSVPFYLLHPRLKSLEKAQMLEVEGAEEEEFLKLLRHETGHCFDSAYQLSRKKKWKMLFGASKRDYDPHSYRPMPYSKSYVQYLDNWYAQAHPDEDFAETFAVWLDPKTDWQKKYKKWKKAYEKLLYVEELSVFYSTKEPRIPLGRKLCEVKNLRSTLRKYYKRRIKELETDYPAFYDEDLSHLFSGSSGLLALRADKFLKQKKKFIVRSVSYWTSEKKITIQKLVDKLIKRAQQLELYIGADKETLNFEVAAYLCHIVTHYQFTGKFRRSV